MKYVGESGQTWERFYDTYDRWSRTGEYDRDPMKIYWESNNDRHRGVGSIGH